MSVCTIISRTETVPLEEVKNYLNQLDIDIVETEKINENIYDIHTINSQMLNFKQELNALANKLSLDITIQPEAHRHKKLVVFDMDSTLIQNECIDLIAASVGVEDKVAKITEAAMRGELDFCQSLKERVSLLKGVPNTIYKDVINQISLSPGAADMCKNLKQKGVKLVVLSGGFQPIVDWIKSELNLDYAFANHLQDDGKALTGLTEGRIVDGAMKAQLLEEIAQKEGIPLEDTLAVGDGSNDLLMMAKAGYGVAWHAKPKVQEQAPARLNSVTLNDIYYILGYN